MAELLNVFSWSKSRDEQFRECQRKYFYDKYASWGGWDAKAPQEMRMAYILKNLKNRWAWKGETVHHVIEHILKSMRAGQFISLENALTHLTEIMRRDYRSSKAKKYLEDPKRNVGLFEHEYQRAVSDDTWKKIHDSSAECIKNFYQSDFFKELMKDEKKDWLIIEDLEEFTYDDARIYVKLDFARQKDGYIEIYDWKTGKADKNPQVSVQIGAYAIYAMQKWNVPLDKIRTYLFNVTALFPKAAPQTLSEELLVKTRETMSLSIKEMRTLLIDPKKNIPHPKASFKLTDDPMFCDRCNFFKICEKSLATV